MDPVSYNRNRFRSNTIESQSIKTDTFKPQSNKAPTPMTWFQKFISRSRWIIILVSLAIWAAILNNNERTSVKRTLEKCSWSKWEDWKKGNPHRIALFADPQIMDAYSYPGRPKLINFFAGNLIDNYHRRNWAYVNKVLDPDSTIFLGDLFDGGRNWNDDDWFEEFTRFDSIFPKAPNKRTIMSLPGNHDIGFGETVNVTSLQRYKSIFGPTSSLHELGNHSIVILDTISLSDFSNEEVLKDPKEVLESVSKFSTNEKPRILLTHVPLYRFPDKQPCGPLRESKKKFPIMQGEQYQTVLQYDLSQEILSKVRPRIIFSGDDHDYCHITHPYEFEGDQRSSEEITVKSCAMNMGIKYPAIQLLSLNTEGGGETYKTQICYLPAPYTTIKIYIFTLILNLLSFIVIFLLPNHWNRFTSKFTNFLPKYDSFALPIAETTKTYKITPLEKDWISLWINTTWVAIGIFLLFTVYFGAFK